MSSTTDTVAASRMDFLNPGIGWLIGLAERQILPDTLVRLGIRRLMAGRRREVRMSSVERRGSLRRFLHENEGQLIALHTDKANQQHYQVPAKASGRQENSR